MTRRISAVALCCSAPSVSACCSCAYGTPGWPLSLALLSGTPHARQKSACEGLSYWHRGHFMPEPPSGRVGERSEPWAETTRPGLAWSRTRSHGSRLGTVCLAAFRRSCYVCQVVTEFAISDGMRPCQAPRVWLQPGANPLPAANRVDALTAGQKQGLEFVFWV